MTAGAAGSMTGCPRRRLAAATVAIVAIVAAFGAAAASPPLPPFPFPQTDVTVVYDLPGVSGATQTLRVDAARAIERVDAPGGGLVVITDVARGIATLFDPTTRFFVRDNAPGGAHDPRGARALAAAYVFAGESTVNGERCTDWRTAGSVTLCLTADGVALLVSRDGAPGLVARSVRRGDIDPAWFALPPDARPAPTGPGAPADRT